MKKSICILLSLVVVMGASAGDGRLEKINSIKKDSGYLYGEATVSTQEQATTLAYEELQREVYAWLQNDSLSVKDINRMADTIMVRIVNVYRVFAYVEKSKLKPGSTLDSTPDSTLFTDSVRQVIQKRFFGKYAALKGERRHHRLWQICYGRAPGIVLSHCLRPCRQYLCLIRKRQRGSTEPEDRERRLHQQLSRMWSHLVYAA